MCLLDLPLDIINTIYLFLDNEKQKSKFMIVRLGNIIKQKRSNFLHCWLTPRICFYCLFDINYRFSEVNKIKMIYKLSLQNRDNLLIKKLCKRLLFPINNKKRRYNFMIVSSNYIFWSKPLDDILQKNFLEKKITSKIYKRYDPINYTQLLRIHQCSRNIEALLPLPSFIKN